jgi:hypothetical protein
MRAINLVLWKESSNRFSRLRLMALTLLQQVTTTKAGIKARRIKAGWDETCLLKILRLKI